MTSDLWPYEEIQIQPVSPERIQVRTPWFLREMNLSGTDHAKLKLIAEGGQQVSVPEQREFWNKVFAPLREVPIFYFLPRELSECGPDPAQASGAQAALEAMTHSFVQQSAEFLPPALREQLVTRDWDLEGALAFARIPGSDLYDPVSLFSLFRRFYYLDAIEFDQTRQMYADLVSLRENPEVFKWGSFLVTFQNYAVTRRCGELLKPALALAKSQDEFLQEFIEAEHGHDKILSSALQALEIPGLRGADFLKSQALPITNFLLDLFQFIAQKNLLSFALAVSFFEEASPTGRDPLTETLRAGDLAKAAAHLQTHAQINDQGGHENVGLRLIEKMAPVSAEYVSEALSLTEALSKALNLVSSNLLHALEKREEIGPTYFPEIITDSP